MIYYARMIVEENIGDLRDPKFDAVANFMHHTRRSYAWSQIVQDVAAELLLFSGIVTLDSPPECISTIKSHYLRALVAEVFAADHQSELITWAEEIVTANLPNLEPKLRLLCDYERPPTLLSDCTSEPYTGLDAKRFVMSTHDVPFERIQAFMRTFSGDLHIEQLPLPQPEGAPGIHILAKKQDNVVEIISHSSIDALMVGLDEGAPVMEVQFDAGVTDYVLLVSRTAEGDNKLVLMVKDVAQFQKAEPEDGQALPFTQEALFV